MVAVNKIDKPEANPDTRRARIYFNTRSDFVRNFGGDVQFVPVSAKKGMGIDDLLDANLTSIRST